MGGLLQHNVIPHVKCNPADIVPKHVEETTAAALHSTRECYTKTLKIFTIVYLSAVLGCGCSLLCAVTGFLRSQARLGSGVVRSILGCLV